MAILNIKKRRELSSQGLKYCSKCAKIKSVLEFYKRGEKYSFRYRSRCITCERAEHTLWKKHNPERVRNYSTIWNYGVSLMAVNKALQKQNNCCAICNQMFIKTPHVDHDHETAEFRGLLCSACNTGLGQFKDDPEILRRAIHYLTRV